MRRKLRKSWIVLALRLLLPACEKGSVQVYGPVTELQAGEDGVLTGLVVRTREGKQAGVLLNEETYAIPTGNGPWTGGEVRREFQKDLRLDRSGVP